MYLLNFNKNLNIFLKKNHNLKFNLLNFNNKSSENDLLLLKALYLDNINSNHFKLLTKYNLFNKYLLNKLYLVNNLKWFEFILSKYNAFNNNKSFSELLLLKFNEQHNICFKKYFLKQMLCCSLNFNNKSSENDLLLLKALYLDNINSNHFKLLTKYNLFNKYLLNKLYLVNNLKWFEFILSKYNAFNNNKSFSELLLLKFNKLNFKL